MTPNRYKVIFDGKIVDGYEVEQVKKNLALFYKIDSQKIERIFAKPGIVIRKNVDHSVAMKYKKAFEKAGAICEMVSDGGFDRQPSPPVGVKNEVSKSTGPGPLICPNCGYEQEESLECERCGIIFRKYRERMNNPPLASVRFKGQSPALRQTSKRISPWAIIVPIISILLILFTAHTWWKSRPIYHGPGMVAPHVPTQTMIRDGEALSYKDFRITPLATFSVEARVLSTKKYRSGRESDLAPIDFALGWGPMSDEAVLKDIEISQSNRFYFWRTRHFPIPRKAIEENSANMHLISASRDIRKRLSRVRKGDVVRIKGYLVKVDAGDNWHWQSSLTRKDTGEGACELVWVEEFEIL